MTNTNRFGNRLLLVAVGIVLLCAGLAALALALLPAVAQAWDEKAPYVSATAESLLLTPAVDGTRIGWVSVGILAILLLLIGLLVTFVVRQGRGRTGRLLTQHVGDTSTTIVESEVATELLQTATHEEQDMLATHVSAFRAKEATTLKIDVTCQRGASPHQIGLTVDSLLTALDDTLGFEVPAYVQLRGGFRAHHTARTRFGE